MLKYEILSAGTIEVDLGNGYKVMTIGDTINQQKETQRYIISRCYLAVMNLIHIS